MDNITEKTGIKTWKKKKKTSRSHTKRHQDIINCYKGKAALSRAPTPASLYGWGDGGRQAPQVLFVGSMAQQIQKKHGKGNYNNLPQYSSFPEYKCVKSTPFDQKTFPELN